VRARAYACDYVRACVRALVCVCVCVCARARARARERGCSTQSPDITAYFNISIPHKSSDIIYIIYRAVWGDDGLPLEDWDSLYETHARHLLCLCFPAPCDEQSPPPPESKTLHQIAADS
jgi:hypothetical protein